MATTLFNDTFSGSGALAGRAPDVGFGSEVWIDGSMPGVSAQMSSGFVVSSNTTLDASAGQVSAYTGAPTGTEIYNAADSVVVEFDVATGTTSVANGEVHVAVVGITLGGTQYAVSIRGIGNGTSLSWTLQVGTVATSITVADNTTYPVTFTAADGELTATFDSTTLSDTSSSMDFYDPSLGVNEADVTVDSTMKVGPLTITGIAVPSPIALPSLTFSGTGTVPLEPIMNLPSLQATGSGSYYAAVTLPMLTIKNGVGGIASASLPALAAYGAGHDSSGERGADISLPAITLAAQGGANGTMTLGMLTVSITATIRGLASADQQLPALQASGLGVTTALAKAASVLPMFDMIGYGGAVLSITLNSGVTVTASGTAGGVATVTATLPMFEVATSATAQNHGGLTKSLPALQMTPNGKALVLLPGLELTAIGTAVIAVTYEAYALNLNHKPRRGEDPIDELTHFTNYPFDYIVRHQNSYFGVNSTGLYLLEGTTDDTAPIQWAFETVKTDFKSDQLKTVESAYFGGSMGPEATVTIKASGSADATYTYTTPRGAAAQNYRQPLGRGLKARYFALGAASEGVLNLDSITFNKAVLARKV